MDIYWMNSIFNEIVESKKLNKSTEVKSSCWQCERRELSIAEHREWLLRRVGSMEQHELKYESTLRGCYAGWAVEEDFMVKC